MANIKAWDFEAAAPALKIRPFLILTAEDGNTGYNQKFAASLRAAGDKDVTEIHMDTDHSYSDHGIALEICGGGMAAQREREAETIKARSLTASTTAPDRAGCARRQRS